MGKLLDQFNKIPWTSFGRTTPISRLGKSVVPVGNHTAVRPPSHSGDYISSHDPAYEDWIMDIQGTAFQVGRGKLLTCWHVVQALNIKGGQAYIQADTKIAGLPAKRFYPISHSFNFIDPRTNAGNSKIDVGILLCMAAHSEDAPYDIPVVKWGDSTKLGVGDRVLIGGYPLGRDMFLMNETNRALVQPTFFDGIISAIMPASQPGETRMLQISSIALGGISGGVVCCAQTGKVVGMVTSGLTEGDVSLPITYAVPSEVLEPWAAAISFEGNDGEIWR